LPQTDVFHQTRDWFFEERNVSELSNPRQNVTFADGGR
jgi:hypothetical protein